MARLIRVEYKNSHLLEEGDQLYYNAASDDRHIEAWVTVTDVGGTGVMVDVDEIVEKGAESNIEVGDNIVAGFNELSLSIRTK